jgi:hypothetical protein
MTMSVTWTWGDLRDLFASRFHHFMPKRRPFGGMISTRRRVIVDMQLNE